MVQQRGRLEVLWPDGRPPVVLQTVVVVELTGRVVSVTAVVLLSLLARSQQHSSNRDCSASV